MPRWPPGWSGGPEADGGRETMTDQSPDVVWQDSLLPSGERWSVLGQTGVTVWFTGLSGSGKSSVAAACERLLVAAGRPAYLLDGDNLRHGCRRSRPLVHHVCALDCTLEVWVLLHRCARAVGVGCR